MAFEEQVAEATTQWDAAKLLVRLWQDRPGNVRSRRERREDDNWLDRVDDVRAQFTTRAGEELTQGDRDLLLRVTAGGTDSAGIDAAGFGLGLAVGRAYADQWRAEHGDAHEPKPGEPFPVAEPSWPALAGDGARRTPRMLSAAGLHDDDHPCVRVYRPSGSLVLRFDFRLDLILRQVATAADQFAALIPNQGLEELGCDTPRPIAFKVEAPDEKEQEGRLRALIDATLTSQATIAVLPELSSSQSFSDETATRVFKLDPPRMIVTGSWHTEEGDSPANIAEAVFSQTKLRMRHRKLTQVDHPFPSDAGDRSREGIERADPPVLSVHAAGPFRVALVICKDALDLEVRALLLHAGVNLLLVPAMSEMTQPFKTTASMLVTENQGATLVANNPVSWNGSHPSPSALLARPYSPGDLLEATVEEAPAMVLFSLSDGAVDTSTRSD